MTPWPLISDPTALFKEDIQEKNNHNRAGGTINSVGDGRAVEYYFASDARWELHSVINFIQNNAGVPSCLRIYKMYSIHVIEIESLVLVSCLF